MDSASPGQKGGERIATLEYPFHHCPALNFFQLPLRFACFLVVGLRSAPIGHLHDRVVKRYIILGVS